jgi:hypothetical protein
VAKASGAVDEAAYVAFSGKRPFVSVISTRNDQDAVLADARARLLDVVGRHRRGRISRAAVRDADLFVLRLSVGLPQGLRG